MKIESVIIENFLAIGKAELSVDDKGLVLLQGENRDDTSQDSNGAGKSTLPDALSWCLYGTTARGETGDDVVNRTVGKECRVETGIVDGDRTYTISRHRKHKKNKNRLIVRKLNAESAKWEDITLGTDKLTQSLVDKIVGCSKDVFCSAIYAGQENLVDLPSMTDKALKVIVEEAAGIDRLQQGHKIANARATQAKKDYAAAQAATDKTQSAIEMTNDNLEALKKSQAEWEKDRDTRMTEALLAKEEEVKKLEAAEEIDVSEEMGAIDVKIGKINTAIDAANKKSSECAVLESKLASGIESVKREKSTYEALCVDVKKVEGQLKAVAKADNPMCDECGQEIVDEESKAAHIKTHKLRVVEARKKAMAQKSLVDAKGSEALTIKSELASAKAKLTDTTKLKAALTKLTERKTELAASASIVDSIREKKEHFLVLFKKARDERSPHADMMKKLDSSLVTLKSQLEADNKVTEEAEHRMLVAEGAAKVFSPAGVRAHLLDQVTPYLNDRTSHYLSILSDGNISATWTTLAPDSKGELKEKFSIAVESTTGGGSFKSLSGGEKRKVRLSTYLALQDLVSSRASKPINLLIADEIDQAVDKSGLERLMSILTEKAKERGTAIVISHTDLKSWISNSVTIVKEEGKSRIEGTALS